MATTSGGLAFSLGKPDGQAVVSREETLANAKAILQATNLPVSADLENGYGEAPEACAGTILLAAEIGLCGGSIEDTTGRPDDPIYPFELSVPRFHPTLNTPPRLSSPFTPPAHPQTPH